MSGTSARVGRPFTTSLEQKRRIEGWAFILPWVGGFLLFVAWPLAYSLYLSFQKVSVAGFRAQPVGLQNYKQIFIFDTAFLPMLLRTVGNVLVDTPVILFFSLVVAVMLNKEVGGRAFLRSLFFLPVVIGTGYVIRELFGQGVGGISVALGIEGDAGSLAVDAAAVTAKTPSIVNVSAALNAFLGADVASAVNKFLNRLGLVLWRSGIQILLFLAGLQGISITLYEAARIDGASEWEVFWKVTFPIISPIMLAVIIFTIIDTFVDVFNEVVAYIHAQAFQSFNFGYSSALAWTYFLTVFILITIVTAMVGRRVFYRGSR